MNIQFATCERKRALGYLQKVYPSKEILDTPESAKPLLDFVEKDVVRIQDPMMYGSKIGIVPGNNWDANQKQAVIDSCQGFI